LRGPDWASVIAMVEPEPRFHVCGASDGGRHDEFFEIMMLTSTGQQVI
jgi:hypothetical protein